MPLNELKTWGKIGEVS